MRSTFLHLTRPARPVYQVCQRWQTYCPTVHAAAAAPPRHWATALTVKQAQQAEQFIDMLLDRNRQLNLTAVRDRDAALERHIGDSLALLPVMDAAVAVSQAAGLTRAEAVRIIDVGSGGGLPGMVLAVARPHWQVTMLDCVGKRLTFVQEAAAALQLPNAVTLWSRAEDAGRLPQHREAYDLAVARAVADMRVLAEYCLPLVRPGGHWVAAKGPGPEEEVEAARAAIQQLGGALVGVQLVESFSEGGQRTAVTVGKARATDARYPRAAGQPKRRPL